MNLVKFSGHNAGGIVAMWLLELGAYKGVQYDATTGLFKLLNDFAEFGKVYFTEDTCEAEITEKRINEIEFEFSAKIPKMRVDALNLWKGMRVPFVMLFQDCNDQFYLAGSEIDPLFSNFKQVPGSSFADFNHLLFSVKRDLILKPKLIYDPRPKPGVVVPEEPIEPTINGFLRHYIQLISQQLPLDMWGNPFYGFPDGNNDNIFFYFSVINNSDTSNYYATNIEDWCRWYAPVGGGYNLPIFRCDYLTEEKVSGNCNVEMDIICPIFPDNCSGLYVCFFSNTGNRYGFVPKSEIIGKTEDTHIVFVMDKLSSYLTIERLIIGFATSKYELKFSNEQPSILQIGNMKLISS